MLHLLFRLRLRLSSLTGIDFWLLWLNFPGKGWLRQNNKVLVVYASKPLFPFSKLVNHQPGYSTGLACSHMISSFNSDTYVWLCHPFPPSPMLWRLLGLRMIWTLSRKLTTYCLLTLGSLYGSARSGPIKSFHYSDTHNPYLPPTQLTVFLWQRDLSTENPSTKIVLTALLEKIAGGTKETWWVDTVMDFWPFIWQ